jgi:hypothetical protein
MVICSSSNSFTRSGNWIFWECRLRVLIQREVQKRRPHLTVEPGETRTSAAVGFSFGFGCCRSHDPLRHYLGSLVSLLRARQSDEANLAVALAGKLGRPPARLAGIIVHLQRVILDLVDA